MTQFSFNTIRSLILICRLVLRSLSEQWRQRRRRGAFETFRSRITSCKAYSPLLWRSIASLRSFAENCWRYPWTRRFWTLWFEGLHSLPCLWGRGRLQETQYGEVWSFNRFHFRIVSHVQTINCRLELLSAPVFKVSCFSRVFLLFESY